MISFVFFDIGDTLLHKPCLFNRISSVLKLGNVNRSIEEIRFHHTRLRENTAFPDTTDEKFYRGFNTKLLTELNIRISDNLIDDIYTACKGAKWQPSTGIECIAELDCDFGVLSNWDHTLRSKINQLLPLDFKEILISAEIGLAKPSHEIFRAALQRIEKKPNEVAIVGDSIKLDIAPASELGWHAFLYDPHNCHEGSSYRRVSTIQQAVQVINETNHE